MTAAGNITFTYDDAGNMATKVVNQETTTYSWDFRNKMLKADFPSGDDPVMRYDGEGTRAKKVVGGTTTLFLYDVNLGVPGLLFETDGSGSEVAEYRRGASGGLLAMERSSILSWHHFDRRGSSRALTDSSEGATDAYAYDAWGAATASSGSTANAMKFGGAYRYYTEPDTGSLMAAGAVYDPGTGGTLDGGGHPAARPASVGEVLPPWPPVLPPVIVGPPAPIQPPQNQLTGWPGILPPGALPACALGALAYALYGVAARLRRPHLHCMVSCYLSRDCSLEQSIVLGIALELVQGATGIGTYDPEDSLADAVGANCPLSRIKSVCIGGVIVITYHVPYSCHECCADAGYGR